MRCRAYCYAFSCKDIQKNKVKSRSLLKIQRREDHDRTQQEKENKEMKRSGFQNKEIGGTRVHLDEGIDMMRTDQAPRAWFATSSKHSLEKNGYKGSWCDEFEALMKSRFQMSFMGELTFFLGLQVKQNKAGIFISQDKYVAEILKKFDLVNVKTAITTMETKWH
ncbi:putative ribonuclease H-like domain-containing protein [Tanacetum coccineum]|uniref:Ribonuclease H-like domain-containing protein n=1 Tax=Tanacetum coccineum TaxID=301880 RepID=A0ABQ5J613_9ASTR